MQNEEVMAKLELIEEQARLTLDEFPRLSKERQRMIISLAKHIRWLLTNTNLDAADPEATIRLPNDRRFS